MIALTVNLFPLLHASCFSEYFDTESNPSTVLQLEQFIHTEYFYNIPLANFQGAQCRVLTSGKKTTQ